MKLKKETLWGWILILPLTLGLTLWVAFPVGVSVFMSLFKWNMISPAQFIGLENFRFMFFQDHLFWQSVSVMFLYTLTSVPLQLALAFSMALLLNTKVKGMGIFRTIYYLPSLIPVMVSTALWMFLYNPQFGLFNLMLDGLGLPTQEWLRNPDLVIPSLVLMSLWSVGNIVIIFLAGLQNIPKELMEACTIDGGNAWHRMRNIVLPFMSPILFYNLVMGIVGGMQTFTQPYVMTNGGPSNASLTYVLHLYKQAFQFSKMGYANALALVLLIVTVLISLIVFQSSKSWVYYSGDKK
ncbi:MAG: ABC transporter permease [Treponema sp. GWB1_62_6]|nr:MAG: ABC transporter permease [Treponema sp. GWA1_62_8]OHE68364.1 MAG: ABC transporter permease [Treponema sp. GWC1_61_84]OHE71712.1 MAG: ABC transporter permease [Treponema sp. GWB1_62_6]OHE73733.1 MAG: ABC transporter permease [Treponema sp. RIFOXYC1_FULL_61_9]HCM28766.1 ABC transporter permease [Treponema sp.]